MLVQVHTDMVQFMTYYIQGKPGFICLCIGPVDLRSPVFRVVTDAGPYEGSTCKRLGRSLMTQLIHVYGVQYTSSTIHYTILVLYYHQLILTIHSR